MQKKYSESVVRHTVLTAEGDRGEVLERITLESRQLDDGSWSEPQPYLRRYDTRAGEHVRRADDGVFEIIETGLRLTPE